MCLLCVDSDPSDTHDTAGPLTWDMFATACQAVGCDLATGAARLAAQVAAALAPPTTDQTIDDTEDTDQAAPVVKTIVFRQPDGTLVRFRQPVTKARTPILNPKRFVFGVAYSADTVDGHGEFIRADELEARAWDYVRKSEGRQIGFFHTDGTTGHAVVVESSIWRGPDWHTQDIDGAAQVIKAGDWVLGAICDEPGFDMVINGPADGWSIDGVAKRRTVPRSSVGKA